MIDIVAVIAFALSAIHYQVPMMMISSKDGAWAVADFTEAITVNIPAQHRQELSLIVAAIRYAENGKPGKEFGIMSKRCKPYYRDQAGWCAATVYKRYKDWIKLGKPNDFIQYLSKSYAPIGAENDPKGLNKNWVPNVKYYVLKQKAAIHNTLGNQF